MSTVFVRARYNNGHSSIEGVWRKLKDAKRLPTGLGCKVPARGWRRWGDTIWRADWSLEEMKTALPNTLPLIEIREMEVQ